MTSANAACDVCLRRSWLLARLAAHLEPVRARIGSVLALRDEELIEAVAGRDAGAVGREWHAFDGAGARASAAMARVEAICACAGGYPPRLLDLESAPAVLHVAGGLERVLALLESDPVAIVGARRASAYGVDTARSLGRGSAAAGLCVVSGMALGVDAAAHAGALAAGGATVAVLPGGPDRPYPASKRRLHRQICATGAAVSELAPGSPVWRWMFPARNRIIAALADLTVVVEGRARSGALVTARISRELGRAVGAVPGMVSSPLAAGPNGLLAGGAHVVRGPQDILDALFGHGVREALAEDRAPLAPRLQKLLAALGEGRNAGAAVSQAGLGTEGGLAALAELELAGYIRRDPGGRFTVVG